MTEKEALLTADVLIQKMRAVMQRHRRKHGISDEETLNLLTELLEGPEQREIHAATSTALTFND